MASPWHWKDNPNQAPAAPSFEAGMIQGPCWPGEQDEPAAAAPRECPQFRAQLSFPGCASECWFPLLREARAMAAGSRLGSWDKESQSSLLQSRHCLTTCGTCRDGWWGLLGFAPSYRGKNAFSREKTIWKNTAKYIDNFGIVASNRGSTDCFTVGGIFVQPSLARGNSEVEMHLSEQIPSLRYQIYQQNNDQLPWEAFSQTCSI